MGAVERWLVSASLREKGLVELTDAQVHKLAALLKAHPRGLAHPAIFEQILHLRKLARTADADELPTAAVDDETPPAGTRQKALEVLQRLVTAWSQGLLPGCNVTIDPRVRRGAPRKWKSADQAEAELYFAALKDEMSQRPPIDFKPRRRRSPDGQITQEEREAFLARVARLAQDLHWVCPICAGDDLPDEDARAIAVHALGKTKVDKHRLMFALMARCLLGSLAKAGTVRSILRK